jgi:hypothetical protein
LEASPVSKSEGSAIVRHEFVGADGKFDRRPGESDQRRKIRRQVLEVMSYEPAGITKADIAAGAFDAIDEFETALEELRHDRAIHCQRGRWYLGDHPNRWRSRDVAVEEECGGDKEDERDEDGYRGDVVDLLKLLDSIETQRWRLKLTSAELESFLDRYPETKKTWEKCTAKGGLSAEDFRQFLTGHFRPRTNHQRRHLRLVASRQPESLRRGPVRCHGDDGDDAA